MAKSTIVTRTTLAFVIALATSAFPLAINARDDVPTDISSLENPVTLEDTEIRYYTRQFKGKCARCHGPDGKGGSEPVEPPLVPPADLTDAAYMTTRTDGQLFFQIMQGGGERCAMPAFGPESDHAWSEEKVWHMVAYVRRFAAGGGTP